MKIKITNKAWYNGVYYNPDTFTEEKVIEYSGEKCPSWGEVVGTQKVAVEDKGENGEGKPNKPNSVKVGELPLVEKNAIIEEAKAAGIEGNQILSWKVETLKAKIEEAKANQDKDKEEDGEDKGENGEE